MNDYVFKVVVSRTDGSKVRQKNMVVCAENVEAAYDRLIYNISNTDDIICELVNVTKL